MSLIVGPPSVPAAPLAPGTKRETISLVVKRVSSLRVCQFCAVVVIVPSSFVCGTILKRTCGCPV